MPSSASQVLCVYKQRREKRNSPAAEIGGSSWDCLFKGRYTQASIPRYCIAAVLARWAFNHSKLSGHPACLSQRTRGRIVALSRPRRCTRQLGVRAGTRLEKQLPKMNAGLSKKVCPCSDDTPWALPRHRFNAIR
jgi:hypothetical protein